MPRRRTDKNNLGLPKHWRYNHGSYYYVVPVSKRAFFDKGTVRLGKTLQEAHAKFALLTDAHEFDAVLTISDLCDRYQTEILPLNKTRTQELKLRSLKVIRRVFDKSPVHLIEPQHVYKFHKHREKESGNRTARAEVEVLRHIYTCAVQWGVVNRHPFKGEVRLAKNPPRDRYVTDEELDNFYRNFANQKIRAYIDLKLLTGLAIQDILTIKMTDIKPDGLHVHRKKTKGLGSKKKVYQWDDRNILVEVVRKIQLTHSKHSTSEFLFHTRTGKGYYPTNGDGSAAGKPDGWNSMWQRRMKLFELAGNARFTDHDLRAKAASDTDLEHAQVLLDHSSPETTIRVYRRAPIVAHINS
jgi:integrase